MNSDASLFVLLLTIELAIPNSQSLKDKRRPLKSLKERIRSRFNASVAEVAFQDKWQRTLLAASMVGSERRRLETEAGKLRQLIEETPDIQLAKVDMEWL